MSGIGTIVGALKLDNGWVGRQSHVDALQEQERMPLWPNREEGCNCVDPRNLIRFGGGACRAGLLLAPVA